MHLRPGPTKGSNYINASFINVRPSQQLDFELPSILSVLVKGYKQKGAYIAAQCPLENTVADFWRMMNEFKCGCIVMLCQLQEEGKVSLTPVTFHPGPDTTVGELPLFLARGGRSVCGAWKSVHQTGVSQD